jgi:hypothetical protein
MRLSFVPAIPDSCLLGYKPSLPPSLWYYL